MKDVKTIVGVWIADEPEAGLAVWVKNVALLAKLFHAKAQICAPAPLAERAAAAVTALSPGASHLASQVQRCDARHFADEVRKTLELRHADLLVLPCAQGAWRLDAACLSQCSSVPVAYLPDDRLLPDPPFASVLVPMSGEGKENEALASGLMLASTCKLPVDVVHVSGGEKPEFATPTLLSALVDEVQHEYPARLQYLVARGCPYTSVRARLFLRSFTHCRGDVVEVLGEAVRQGRRPLLLVEWGGKLDGHAVVVKALIEKLGAPLLLVRSQIEPPWNLKVGSCFVRKQRQPVTAGFVGHTGVQL